MSRDMEDRLRAAFDAKTNGVTAASLRSADTPQDDDVPSDGMVTSIHRHHRWIAPLLAAAAVIAVAAGTTAAVTISAESDHSHPANTHSPTPTSTTPSTTPSPSVAPSTTPAGGGAPPPGTSTGSTSTAPPVTKKLTVQGVTLDVPTNWDFAALDNRCLTINGLPPDPVVPSRHCQLEISVISASQAASGGFNPDKPYVIGDGNMCGSSSNAPKVTTVQAINTTVGGQLAEYRSYTGECFKGTWEQWTVPTAPGVIITRSYADPATEQAALYAVTNAQLPGPRSQLRLSDRGIIRSVTTEADGVHIELDRVTRLEQGGISNTNPVTYSYVLPANLQISADTADLKMLTVQQLVQLANGKTVDGVAPPLSTLLADLDTDGNHVIHLSLVTLSSLPH